MSPLRGFDHFVRYFLQSYDPFWVVHDVCSLYKNVHILCHPEFIPIFYRRAGVM